MKTRKVWASRRAFESNGHFGAFVEARSAVAPIPVLVTDASDMPDFEPGDRVRDRDDIGTVTHPPICVDGKWLVPVRFTFANNERGLGTQEQLWWASRLTKLPREKTVTLRVTGPEGRLRVAVLRMTGGNDEIEGCRVERVEDDDE